MSQGHNLSKNHGEDELVSKSFFGLDLKNTEQSTCLFTYFFGISLSMVAAKACERANPRKPRKEQKDTRPLLIRQHKYSKLTLRDMTDLKSLSALTQLSATVVAESRAFLFLNDALCRFLFLEFQIHLSAPPSVFFRVCVYGRRGAKE